MATDTCDREENNNRHLHQRFAAKTCNRDQCEGEEDGNGHLRWRSAIEKKMALEKKICNWEEKANSEEDIDEEEDDKLGFVMGARKSGDSGDLKSNIRKESGY